MLVNLLEKAYPDWITTSFPVIRIIFMIALVISALAIIVLVMMAESNPDGGANVISGTNDSFYAQNQSSTKEGRIKKGITIMAIILVAIVVLFFISYIIYPVGI